MKLDTKIVLELSKEESKILLRTLEKVKHTIGVSNNKHDTEEVELSTEIIKELE